VKRAVTLALAAAVLALLWWKTGVSELGETLSTLDPAWLAGAMALFVPQTLLSAVRWRWIVGFYQPISTARATAAVLASSSLNVILPSKMGDLLKGATLDPAREGGDLRTGLLLGVLEKALDTAALCALMLGAAAFAPPGDALAWFLLATGGAGVAAFVALALPGVSDRLARLEGSVRGGLVGKGVRLVGSAAAILTRARRDPARLALVGISAVALWALHVLQFSMVHRAAAGTASEALVWSRVPMAILVGLLPVTFAGIGTRDAAFVHFLGAAAGKGPALALGVLGTLRYAVPALAGLPFLAAHGGVERARAALAARRARAREGAATGSPPA
jgi:uncharacterized membrane protein YbhN (UPF0104 family)